MAALTFSEQVHLARLSFDRTRRSLLARALRSPLLRWRYGAPVADELLVVPQDLRTPDPSFAAEIAQGQFGLAGRVASLKTGSPFEIDPPSLDWARDLHGFSWLGHLRAADGPEDRARALSLVAHWIRNRGCGAAVAWEPAVIGRRLMSWIVNSELLLSDVDGATYELITSSLAAQLIELSATWRDGADGHPRLVALTGLLYGDLCIDGHDHRLADVERLFAYEIVRQIRSDGGHISRNPGVLVELLLDLLPLRQCFINRERRAPAALDEAIARMLAHVRFMRLGDSSLAHFNGMGASPHDAVATVLAYGDDTVDQPTSARSSRYVRLQQGASIVLMDVGKPPPLEFAAHAHAGCLSFEMSSGAIPVFVNGGAPGPAEAEWRQAARATAAHNTLCLAGKSSSRLVRHPRLERLIGAAPISQPRDVRARLMRTDEQVVVEAAHDGYLVTSRLVHFRRLALDAAGTRLTGQDRLGPPRGQLRLERDLPFSIAFHLQPDTVWESHRGREAILTLRNGERWRFAVTGAALSVEEGTYYADNAGPRVAHQIVLREATFGDTCVDWTLERVEQ